ncbi:MAG: family 78 glycoside hydrolase catalytic domain, partial [Clostridia bacterium]|nr:family 78 glycoside hydrolase catalytic domain [Clostridia bacterium]
MKEKYNYSREYRDFSSASLISAPAELCRRFDRPKEPSFPEAKFIWPHGYVRCHLYRLFTPRAGVKRVSAAFLCDNLFDVWVNGVRFATDTRHLELTDVTSAVTDGQNCLCIRAYQSSTYETFSAAITGGIRIEYADGTVEELLTDGEFFQKNHVGFWETKEPEGFEVLAEKPSRVGSLTVTDIHPIALRRSCYFVREFGLDELPVSAKLYSTARGCYEPYMNGQRVTDSFFMPFYQVYQLEYQEFDVLSLLRVGKNAVGAVTGNGWYNCSSWGSLKANVPELLACLELEFADGRKTVINTDGDWVCAPSPLVENDLQYGERYVADMEIEGWCEPYGDRSDFVPAASRENTELARLLRQSYPFVKKMKEYNLTPVRTLPDGSPFFDVGVNIAGRARVRLRGLRPGQKIRLRYCERIMEDGVTPDNGAYTTVFYQNDCAPDGRSAAFLRNVDVYTARGEGEEVYECRFSYTGFRYMWIEGLDSPDQLCELTAFELRTEVDEVGSISTDCEAITKIYQAARRSWLDNICNGPTDCPTREKNFWNGDAEIFVNAACWLTDNSSFLSRWTDNCHKCHSGPYAWEDEEYVIPLTLYRFYGDEGILRARFPKMLELIKKRSEEQGYLIPKVEGTHQYCDWLSPTGVSPSKDFFGGCWFYHMLYTVSKIAAILGEDRTAAELAARAAATREEFNRLHLVDGGQDYDARCQCGIVLPMAFGIAPEEHREALAARLVKYIEEADYHLTTGFIGTR